MNIQIPRDLLESVFDDLLDLQSAKDWTKDEPRRGYADKYNELVGRIQQVKDLIEPPLDEVALEIQELTQLRKDGIKGDPNCTCFQCQMLK